MNLQCTLRDETQSAPLEVRPQFERLGHQLQCLGVAFGPHHPRVLVLDLAASFADLLQQHVHRRQDVQRLESRDHHRFSVHLGDEPIRPNPHHRGHVARPEEPRQPQVGRLQNGLDRRNDRDVVAEHAEVLHAERTRPDQRDRGGRRRGLEPDREENDLAVGVVDGDLERVERGVHESHVGAAGVGLDQVSLRPRHPHHVAERREDDAGLLGQPHRVVHPAHRDHAHRTAGSVHQLDGFGQQVLDSVPVDGVRVTAAHLHELEMVGARQLGDGLDQRTCGRRVPEFVDESHCVSTLLVMRSPMR